MTPRPTGKQRKATALRSRASAAPIVIGPDHPMYERLRQSFEEEPLTTEETEAHLLSLGMSPATARKLSGR